MPHRSSFRGALPSVPFLLGMCLSTWRFRAGDSVGGLLFGLGGVVAMLVMASWLLRETSE